MNVEMRPIRAYLALGVSHDQRILLQLSEQGEPGDCETAGSSSGSDGGGGGRGGTNGGETG